MTNNHFPLGQALACVLATGLFFAGPTPVLAETGDSNSGLTLEEAIASGQCDEGDLPCLNELIAQADEGSSAGKSWKGKDGKSDDDSKSKPRGKKKKNHDGKSGGDSKSKDKDSRDDDSKSRDGRSDDKSSKDDDSKSDDGSSDDKSSKDDDSKSDDGSSDDKSSKDDDSKSDGGSSDDKSSKDDDSKSDDGSSGDEGSSDDGSSSDNSMLPTVSIGDGQGEEFNDLTQVPVVLSVSLSAPAVQPATVSWATEDGTALAGSDYLAAGGLISFALGEQVSNVTVFIIGDDVTEETESFFVRLSTPAGSTLLDGIGEVVVFNDDDIDE